MLPSLKKIDAGRGVDRFARHRVISLAPVMPSGHYLPARYTTCGKAGHFDHRNRETFGVFGAVYLFFFFYRRRRSGKFFDLIGTVE